MHRAHAHAAQIPPPGCTPRLQCLGARARLSTRSSTAATTTGFVRGHRAPGRCRADGPVGTAAGPARVSRVCACRARGWFVNLFWRALRQPHMTQSPGVITWAHGMELEPPEPPRAAVIYGLDKLSRSAGATERRRWAGGWGAFLPAPSPEQRDKVTPLGTGVKPPCRADYCRELEAPEVLSRWGAKPLPPLSAGPFIFGWGA
jgi:hypothetical protein